MYKRVLTLLAIVYLSAAAFGTSSAVAENSAKCTIATLNASWQQYVAMQMAMDKEVIIPKDYKQACEILVAEKFIEKTPTPPDGYIFELKPKCPKTAIEIQFTYSKNRSQAEEKKEKVWRAKTAKLNKVWQEYCKSQKAGGHKINIPPNLIIAVQILENEDSSIVFDNYMDKDADWFITWRKSENPTDCKFELISGQQYANEMVNEGLRTMADVQMRAGELQQAWDKYRADEAEAMRQPECPKDFTQVYKLLKLKGYIKKTFTLTGNPGFQYYFRAPDATTTGRFGVYFNNRKLSRDIEMIAIRSEVANLTAAWQQYVATKMAKEEKIAIPDDVKQAHEMLSKGGFVEKNIVYLDKIKFQKADKPLDCRFVPVKPAK